MAQQLKSLDATKDKLSSIPKTYMMEEITDSHKVSYDSTLTTWCVKASKSTQTHAHTHTHAYTNTYTYYIYIFNYIYIDRNLFYTLSSSGMKFKFHRCVYTKIHSFLKWKSDTFLKFR